MFATGTTFFVLRGARGCSLSPGVEFAVSNSRANGLDAGFVVALIVGGSMEFADALNGGLAWAFRIFLFGITKDIGSTVSGFVGACCTSRATVGFSCFEEASLAGSGRLSPPTTIPSSSSPSSRSTERASRFSSAIGTEMLAFRSWTVDSASRSPAPSTGTFVSAVITVDGLLVPPLTGSWTSCFDELSSVGLAGLTSRCCSEIASLLFRTLDLVLPFAERQSSLSTVFSCGSAEKSPRPFASTLSGGAAAESSDVVDSFSTCFLFLPRSSTCDAFSTASVLALEKARFRARSDFLDANAIANFLSSSSCDSFLRSPFTTLLCSIDTSTRSSLSVASTAAPAFVFRSRTTLIASTDAVFPPARVFDPASGRFRLELVERLRGAPSSSCSAARAPAKVLFLAAARSPFSCTTTTSRFTLMATVVATTSFLSFPATSRFRIKVSVRRFLTMCFFSTGSSLPLSLEPSRSL